MVYALVWNGLILSLLAKIDFDQDMLNLAFSELPYDLLDLNMRPALMHFIKCEIENVFNIDLPTFEIPSSWFQDPLEYKIFNGSDPALYPQRRVFIIGALRKTSTEDKKATLFDHLKNPLLAEVELALETNPTNPKSKKSTSKAQSKVYDMFIYLDTRFKLKPEKELLNSDLYKNIQRVISGISDISDINVSVFASTWKCVEELMKIVSLEIDSFLFNRRCIDSAKNK
jgi:hypothetical protein